MEPLFKFPKLSSCSPTPKRHHSSCTYVGYPTQRTAFSHQPRPATPRQYLPHIEVLAVDSRSNVAHARIRALALENSSMRR